MLKLKDFEIPSGIIQSPMAGCTDLAFRLIARSYGMEFAFLEMISAEGLVRQNKKTVYLMKTRPDDRPLGAQLVGCNPESMGEGAAQVEDMGYDLLDINLGCPVPKIVSPGAGSALLREPEKCRKIFQSIMKRIKKIPVTVKMRKGFGDASGDEAVRIAQIAEEEGLSAVTVHGRTRVQGYTGTADWQAIGKVKKAVTIPVIGNGDVNGPEDALRLIETSGCDGVMLGRGALGNPWIYRAIQAALHQNPIPETPDINEVKQAALRHLQLEVEIEGEKTAVLKSRKILCWYFKNLPGAVAFRRAVNTAESAKQLRLYVENFGS